MHTVHHARERCAVADECVFLCHYPFREAGTVVKDVESTSCFVSHRLVCCFAVDANTRQTWTGTSSFVTSLKATGRKFLHYVFSVSTLSAKVERGSFQRLNTIQ